MRGVEMERLAFAAPILPGKTPQWREMVAELRRRSSEHERSQRDKGVETEHVWLQETPLGDIVIVYQEGEDLASYMGKLLQSDVPFDRWFAAQLAEVHGFDPSQPPPQMEQIF
jgi:hypothetical protein